MINSIKSFVQDSHSSNSNEEPVIQAEADASELLE